jgi:hypothetical protein
MDNIAQRLGLVIHWVGLLIGVGALIFIIAGEASHHLQTKEYYGRADKSECQRIRDQIPLEVGDCIVNAQQKYFPYEKPYEQLRIRKPSFKNFIDSSIKEIFRIDALVFLTGFLFGWLFRFILAGKVHILPWK